MLDNNQLQSRAKNMLARLIELGFTCNEKSPVIDQVFELVAAEEGFRNQHALRAAIRKEAKKPVAPKLSVAPGFVQVPRELTEDFAKAVMVQTALDDLDWAMASDAWELIVDEADKLAFFTGDVAAISQRSLLIELGYSLAYSDYKLPYWEREGNGSEDFKTEDAAWADAWQNVLRETQNRIAMPDSEWKALSFSRQVELVQEVLLPDSAAELAASPMECAIAALVEQYGDEHPKWPRCDWQWNVNEDYTNLNYWEWVQHQIESAECDPDISAEDKFECVCCKNHFDIDDSIKGDDGLLRCITCINRLAADLAFQEYDFGDNHAVGSFDGWEWSSGEPSLYSRNVYLETIDQPNLDTIRVTFSVDTVDGLAVGVSVN